MLPSLVPFEANGDHCDGVGNPEQKQWRIQDFPQEGAPTPKTAIIFHIFAENCMKMKEFGPPGGGARPWRPPLDPPMKRNTIILQGTS